MTVRFLALLPLTACYKTVHWPTCEDTAIAVADTETTPGGTAADLLNAVSGSGTAEGTLLDEHLAHVAWAVERGEGSARWVESVHTTEELRGDWGFGNTVLTLDPDCHDRLEVPVVASVQTDDDVFAVAVATVAESRPDLGGVQFNIYGTGPYDDATFPPVPGVNPAAFDDKQAFLKLGILDTVSGTAGWEGTQLRETVDSASAHYILEFPVPDI